MKLVVGLGNPGDKYKNNRHNIGFMVLDHFAAENNWSFKKKKNYEFVNERDFVLIKPRTYMNLSGIAVTSALSSYRLDDIIVISDDINLKLGDLRFRRKGGSGGHNGLKSITEVLGSNEFKRFRIGVGAPQPERDLADFVLGNFSTAESKVLKRVISFSSEMLNIYLKEDFGFMLDHYSKNKNTYSEELRSLQDLMSKGGS